MGTSSGAHQAMLLGMRPRDSRYASLSFSNGATELDGALGCVILVSPVIDPLGRYQYAKGLRDDCTPPAGMAERVAPMHDLYWVTEEAMAEAAPARILAGGERTELPPTLPGQCLARTYEEAHPRPDLDEFIRQYRKAGGQIDVTILEGKGEGVLRDGRQDTGNGSGQGWDERAFSAQVAEWAIAVAGETGASVAHSAGSLRRGVGG